MLDPSLAVLEALPRPAQPPAVRTEPGADGDWPGVPDPQVLRGLLLDWLAHYANPGTRRTYAYALGLPVTWIEPQPQTQPRTRQTRPGPPPAAPGPLHDLAWLRWCARHPLDPRAATPRHVKAWLHALDAAGAGRRTRQRMLSTIAAFYDHLTETGVVEANPAAVNRRRLGLASTARDASPTIRLTPGQVRALLDAAAAHTGNDYYRTRAVAVIALLTLGLRISEVVGLDRGDRYRTGGEDVLRVLGKGGLHREVYLTAPVAAALAAHLEVRDHRSDRRSGPTPTPRGRATTGSPLIATRDGNRCSRIDLYTLVRRTAQAAGLTDRIHPHTLRHAYVTIALERGAPIQHVQADVGHASIATTQHYDRARRTRAHTAADLVADALDDR